MVHSASVLVSLLQSDRQPIGTTLSAEVGCCVQHTAVCRVSSSLAGHSDLWPRSAEEGRSLWIFIFSPWKNAQIHHVLGQSVLKAAHWSRLRFLELSALLFSLPCKENLKLSVQLSAT